MANHLPKLREALEGYGSSATIHGMSYIFPRNNKFVERIFWIFAVVIGLYFATKWSCGIYISWKADPVLTTIENFAYPIQNIKFPSITICPQGADNDVLRSVLFKQFNEYLAKKNLQLDKLTVFEVQQESTRFLNETYPGAKQSPDKYVTLFRTQPLESNIKTQANLNPEDNLDQCNVTLDTEHLQKRETNSDICPPRTLPNGYGKCFHLGRDKKTYSDALNYCENVITDRPSSIHQFLDNSDFTSLYKLMDECK